MNMLLTLALIAILSVSANAQGFATGKCLDIPTIKDID